MFFRILLSLVILLAIRGTQALSAEAEEKRAFSLIPVPFVFSQPETGFGGGAMLMAVGNATPENPGQLLDTCRLIGLYTVKKQMSFSLQGEHYTPGNNRRFELQACYSRYSSLYYGIGGPEDGVEEDYGEEELGLKASMGFALSRGLYLGPTFTFENYSMTERISEETPGNGAMEGPSGARVVSPGIRLLFEGRDSSVAASRGYFVDLSASLSSEAIGASSAFNKWALDLRAYATPLEGYKAIIAGQVYAAFIAGDPPYQELPMLGGDTRLRGYIVDEYRDKCMVMAQTEVRLPLWWRFGIVLFGGVGEVAGNSSDFSLDDARFAEGFGLRFLVDKKSSANLRIDAAWGDGGPEVYFQLGEAF
jgi:hypothetical protein